MKTFINNSIQDLEAALQSNDELQQKFRINPIEAMKKRKKNIKKLKNNVKILVIQIVKN